MFDSGEMDALERMIEFRSSMGLSTHDAITKVFGEWRKEARELEVVTAERDNALLRIEELERELDWARPFVEIADPRNHNGPESSYRGGVHPNA